MSEDLPALGSCCDRLRESLDDQTSAPSGMLRHQEKYMFVRDGMLAMTVARGESDSKGPYWVREYARFCPFCGTRLPLPPRH